MIINKHEYNENQLMTFIEYEVVERGQNEYIFSTINEHGLKLSYDLVVGESQDEIATIEISNLISWDSIDGKKILEYFNKCKVEDIL